MEKELFYSCFYIIMSSPISSDILQNNAEILEKQQRLEEKQWLLLQLQEAVKLHWAECIAQKARREAEEAER